jgi:hypothetical protein
VAVIFACSVASAWLARHGEIANGAIVLAITGFLSLSIVRTEAIIDREHMAAKVAKQNLMGVHPWHGVN